jgi:hypothetical protein
MYTARPKGKFPLLRVDYSSTGNTRQGESGVANLSRLACCLERKRGNWGPESASNTETSALCSSALGMNAENSSEISGAGSRSIFILIKNTTSRKDV